MTKNNFELSWQAPEFRHYPKNLGWYITFWAIAILIIGYQTINADYFGAISILLIAGFATYLIKQHPQIVDVTFNEKGLYLDDLHIPYRNMKHFWIVDTETHKTINIQTTAYLNGFLVVELEDQNPSQIRETLIQFIPEHESVEPTMIQKISHRLKL